MKQELPNARLNFSLQRILKQIPKDLSHSKLEKKKKKKEQLK